MHSRITTFLTFRTLALALICTLLGSPSNLAGAQTGVWEQGKVELINKVADQAGWTLKVLNHSSGKMRYSVESADRRWYGESEATWQIPPARLIPGKKLTLTATITKIASRGFTNGGSSCWLWLTDLGFSGRFSTAEVANQVPDGTSVSDTRSAEIPAGSEPHGKQKGYVTANMTANGELAVSYEYIWNPDGKRTGGDDNPPPAGTKIQPEAVDPNTNDTAWHVGHAVPWVFHPDGSIEAKGLWKGTWKKSGNIYTVTIVHQGVSDTFTVEFAHHGKSFTAFKGRQVYRTGTRK